MGGFNDPVMHSFRMTNSLVCYQVCEHLTPWMPNVKHRIFTNEDKWHFLDLCLLVEHGSLHGTHFGGYQTMQLDGDFG